MILTLYYIYATIMQWWKLGILRNKLAGTLNSHNALLVCNNTNFIDKSRKRCLENLLVQKEDRLACTVVPKQVLDLSHWAAFPKDYKYFPIHIKHTRLLTKSPKVHVLVQTNLDNYTPHQSEVIEIENFGELIAWRVEDHFELILKTDLNNLTKFAFSFCDHSIDINHELQLLKIETVDVVGIPTKIKYDRKYPLESRLRYSLAPNHWNKFVQDVRSIYNKVHPPDQLKALEHPRITIETSNKPEESKKVPVSEVKPIKKDHHRKSHHDDDKARKEKHKLEVSIGTTKRSKSSEHRSKEDKDHDRKEHKTKKEMYKSKDGEKLKEKKEISSADFIATEIEKSARETDDRKVYRNDVIPAEKDTKTKLTTQKHRKEHGDKIKKEEKMKYYMKLKEKYSDTDTKAKVEMNKDSRSEVSEKDLQKQEKDTKTESVCKLKSKNSEERKLKREASFEEKDVPCEANTDNSKSYSNKIQIEVPDLKDTNQSNLNSVNIKPPNVLVFADSRTTKDNVKNVLHTILNNNKYTVYDFPVDCSDYHLWTESTGLLVVCGSVPSNLTNQMLSYLLTGGQVLCMCSDLLYSVLHIFSTAEVREHELVRFSYGDWKQVKMMHHVFCYQASPAKKQFSKDSDQSSQSNGSRGSSPVALRTPSAVEIQHNGKKYILQVQVLGTEETWQTPSLLLTSVKNSQGRAIFSQVHLEIDPTEYEDDESKYAALKDSNQARLEILKHLLSYHLEMDCNSEIINVDYTPGYFLGQHALKQKVLNESTCIKDNILANEQITLKFCGKDEQPGPCTATRMPIFILACPSNFSTVQYFETLNTEQIGRLVIYSDIMMSSQYLIAKKVAHGLTVIPRQQTQGVGRSNNIWLSPLGCAMFSLQLHVPLSSPLGKFLSLVQHLVMASIISSIRSLPGYEDLDLGLKWPNDIYAYSKIKIGGVLVTSIVETDIAVLNIGVGLNLQNSEPTTCINDVIKKYNQTYGKNLQSLEFEQYFAIVFNNLENNYKTIQKGDIDYLYDLYYKYWLHSGAEVSITTANKETTTATIIGIDDYGFLKVRTKLGKIVSVQPDGNSFDMLKGLIAPKML